MGRSRVLVIGLDAAERSIVADLVARGRMPAVASLLARGHQAELAAPPDLYVGAVWPTLFTGVPPGVHGRWAPQQLRVGTYETEWIGARSAVEPFWGDLARAGRRVAAIDVPLAPLVERPGVVQVAEWATHDNAGPRRVWPDAAPEVVGELPAVPPDRCDHFHRSGGLADLRSHLLAGVERKADLVEALLVDADLDLVFAVFGESHCIGHQGWHLHDPSHPRHDAAEAAAAGDPIVEVYEALDAAVGRLVGRCDAETTVALLLSHGMGPHYDGTHLFPEVLRRIEDATLGPPPRWRSGREAAIRRVQRLRRGAPHRREDGGFGRLLDGSRRFLRAPNAAPVACVRLNVIGREPRGRVAAGSEYEAQCELLTVELAALVDPADGRPVVERIQRVEEVYAGPFGEVIGDLFVEWRRDRPIDAIASPTVGVVRGAFSGIRTGDHQAGGLLVAAGPGVDPSTFTRPLDSTAFAPLVTGWLGMA